MRIKIARGLVGPAEKALNALGDGNGDPELTAVLRSLEFGLEMLKDLVDCSDSIPS